MGSWAKAWKRGMREWRAMSWWKTQEVRRADKELRSARAALSASESERARLTAAKDAAYSERNQIIPLLARMALALGWTAGVGRHPEEDTAWERDWMTVVYIDTPAGQVSWHFHDSERPLLEGLPPYSAPWDGHDTPEKYRRVAAFRPEGGAGWVRAELYGEVCARVAKLEGVAEAARFALDDTAHLTGCSLPESHGTCDCEIPALRAALRSAETGTGEGT